MFIALLLCARNVGLKAEGAGNQDSFLKEHVGCYPQGVVGAALSPGQGACMVLSPSADHRTNAKER